jgi:hypothetical protein
MITSIINFGFNYLLHAQWWVYFITIPIIGVIGAYLGANYTRRVEFYEDRLSSPNVFDWMVKSKEVWASWNTANWIATCGEISRLQLGERITKVVIQNPESPHYLSIHASLFDDTSKKNLKEVIEYSENLLVGQGVKSEVIHHFDAPILSMMIFNPNQNNSWIRLEPWGASMGSGNRPIIIIRKKKEPKAYTALVNSFNKMYGE